IWHYSIDDGASWNLVGVVSHNDALLLAADGQTRLYFEPTPGFTGTVSDVITFKAWDQTFGVNGGTADASPSGGTTAYSSATETANITVNPIAEIKETIVPITIDGSVDDIWSTAQSYSIDQLASGSISDGADLSGSFRTMWDDTYFYTLIEVNDESIVNDGAFVDDDDFVAWFIDPDYSHGTSYDGVNDYHLGIRVEDAVQFTGIPSETDTTGLLYSVNNGSGSYEIEIAMPWTTLGVTPSSGSLVGFEVKISDDDDGGSRDARLVWNDPADLAYTNPSYFSAMRLIENNIPTIGGIDTGSVTEDIDPDSDDLLEVSGALTITDADAGESSFIAETMSGIYGNLTIDAMGNWAYSADNTQAAIQQLDAGQSVTDTLSVTTADGTTHDVVISINGAEDTPVIGGIAAGTVFEDGTLIANDTLTISDVDANDNP
ncbi:MAG: hypothetical protein EX260_10945, partial [Desulfobulbaceae bacterium]